MSSVLPLTVWIIVEVWSPFWKSSQGCPVIFCTTLAPLTGLVIASSGVLGSVDPETGKLISGAPLTILAFSTVYGEGAKYIVSIALALFAYSTILGWEYYGEKALEYLTRSTSAAMAYRILFSVIAFVGCVSAFEIAWDIADILNALMIVPNAICMILLIGPLYKDMADYQNKM